MPLLQTLEMVVVPWVDQDIVPRVDTIPHSTVEKRWPVDLGFDKMEEPSW
jgi:hypothetical protein